MRRMVLAAVLGLSCVGPAAAQIWQNETGNPLEADFVRLQFPTDFAVNSGTMSPTIFGRIFEAGVTEAPGAAPNVLAQVGYGPFGSDPRTTPGWSWFNATYNQFSVAPPGEDEYQGGFDVPGQGTYSYTFRFSLDAGVSFTLADLNGAGSLPGNDFETSQLGTMTVDGGGPGPAVPEPSALSLLAVPALALGLGRFRRRRRRPR